MGPEHGPLRIELATPCSADWSAMSGDERRRSCAQCRKHVYDLSGLTRDEIRALLSRPEGSPCVRFYQRADGTVLTADCPVGLRERAARLAWRARAAWAAAVVAILGVLGLGAAADVEPGRELPPLPRVASTIPAQAPPPELPPLPAHPRLGGTHSTFVNLLMGGGTVHIGLMRRRSTIKVIKGTTEAAR